MNDYHILVVEDERNIRNFIKTILTSNNYTVLTATTGEDAMTLLSSRCPDLVLLDLGLPDTDGQMFIQAVRRWSQVPILVVSARSHERDKVMALDFGADDYITKPFGTSELLARIRTALRHRQQLEAGTLASQEPVYTFEDLTIDFNRRLVLLAGKQVHLTQIEYKLVSLLARNSGRVLTYDYIIHQIWGPYADNSNNQILRVNMAHIRRKLEANPAEPRYIFTEIGVGYRMQESQKPLD